MEGLEADQLLMKELCRWAGLAPSQVAKRAGLAPTTILRPHGGTATTRISQPTIEKLKAAFPGFPGWHDGDGEEVPVPADVDQPVLIERLPTFAGAGGGGTGEGERQLVAFSGALVRQLGVLPGDLLLIEIEGDSMAPEFLSGDQMLVDKRKRALAQPGAFCLWDGDGYVVKYLEKVPGAEPARVRLISGNPRYSSFERLLEEVEVMGRVIWFGRRV